MALSGPAEARRETAEGTALWGAEFGGLRGSRRAECPGAPTGERKCALNPRTRLLIPVFA
jgi:hypothetical protein